MTASDRHLREAHKLLAEMTEARRSSALGPLVALSRAIAAAELRGVRAGLARAATGLRARAAKEEAGIPGSTGCAITASAWARDVCEQEADALEVGDPASVEVGEP